MIVDDQAPFRRTAKMVMAATPGFDVVGEAESGEEAVDLFDALTPGLVLMDINLPGINGIEATRRITSAHPGATVLLLSTYQAADLPAAPTPVARPATSTKRSSAPPWFSTSGPSAPPTNPPNQSEPASQSCPTSNSVTPVRGFEGLRGLAGG